MLFKSLSIPPVSSPFTHFFFFFFCGGYIGCLWWSCSRELTAEQMLQWTKHHSAVFRDEPRIPGMLGEQPCGLHIQGCSFCMHFPISLQSCISLILPLNHQVCHLKQQHTPAPGNVQTFRFFCFKEVAKAAASSTLAAVAGGWGLAQYLRPPKITLPHQTIRRLCVWPASASCFYVLVKTMKCHY